MRITCRQCGRGVRVSASKARGYSSFDPETETYVCVACYVGRGRTFYATWSRPTKERCSGCKKEILWRGSSPSDVRRSQKLGLPRKHEPPPNNLMCQMCWRKRYGKAHALQARRKLKAKGREKIATNAKNYKEVLVPGAGFYPGYVRSAESEQKRRFSFLTRPYAGEFRLCSSCGCLLYRKQFGDLSFHSSCRKHFMRRLHGDGLERRRGYHVSSAQWGQRLRWLIKRFGQHKGLGQIASEEQQDFPEPGRDFKVSTVQSGIESLIDVLPPRWEMVFSNKMGRWLDSALPVEQVKDRLWPTDTASTI